MKRLLTFCLLCLLPLTGFSQTPSFTFHKAHVNSNDPTVILHGDLNGDGREDLITVFRSPQDDSGSAAFNSVLSNGDGSFKAPISYTFPTAAIPAVLADFNGDGKLDLAALVQDQNRYYLYFGNGDGTFRAPVTHYVSAQMEALGAADVNHDNKTDLLLLTTSDGGNSSDLQVLFANGDGTFRTGPTTHGLEAVEVGQDEPARLLTGDFDADGKADVTLWLNESQGGYQFEVLSGDGAGNFTVTYTDSNPSQGVLEAADVNGDGITDLISTATLYCESPGCANQQPFLIVFYGATNRSMQYAQIPTSGCPTGGAPLGVADFNGDGVPDIAFPQDDCSYYAGTINVAILSGKGSKQFGPQTSVSSTPDGPYGGLYAVRHNIDTRADLVYTDIGSSSVPAAVITLLNQTAGNFPTCNAPNAAVGINVCSPASASTVSSPVNFAVGAVGDTPMRRVEVWADGKKATEQFAGTFSNYSFLNASVPLAAGSHRITIFAAGMDNSLQSKTLILNVGGSSCTAPSSAGVHVCSPVSGSTVSSPVHVQAVGKVTGTFARMEVWVDGVKKYTGTTANVDTTVALAAGSHRFVFYAINTAGQKWQTIVQATVR